MAEMNRSITREEQAALLMEQEAYARAHAPFYRQERAFTFAADICRGPEAFLCVSPKEIARVITLRSSGSTLPPKRMFFTENDIRQTEEFFYYGMRPMVRPGETAAVFMDGDSAYSVGGLLKSALARFGASVRVAGFMAESSACREAAEGAACLVGTPAQMALLAARCPRLRPRTVLLSGERVPQSLRRRLERVWGAETFTHWGMCETGYGGAVEGEDHNGLMIRNDALFVQVCDPATGEMLPVGESGELVFSTLCREGMPLLRYRTGDCGRLIQAEDGLPRLDARIERFAQRRRLADGTVFSPLETDEAAFSFDGVIDCRTALAGDTLTVTVRGKSEDLGDKLRVIYPSLCIRILETEKELPFGHGKRI